MSRIILAGKNQITQMLAGGLCKTVPEANRHLVHGRVMVQDLVPLTWKLEAVLENGNCEHTPRVAAELMCIPDFKRLYAEEHARWEKNPCGKLSAQPGDVIVLLPFNPVDIPASPEDAKPFGHEFTFILATMNEPNAFFDGGFRSIYGHASGTRFRTESFMEDITPHRSEETVRQFLMANPVQVIFVGSRLPADIAHVFRDVDWQSLSLDPPGDLKALLERYSSNTISVFDMIHAAGAQDAELWHRLYFPGRSQVTFGEVAKKLDGILTPLFIKTIATAKLKSMGLTPRSYKEQHAVLKTTFTLPHF